MPLYELVCIARATAAERKKVLMPLTRSLIKASATHVLDNQGVVKSFHLEKPNEFLPYRMKKHQTIFEKGDYWTMQFYSSPSAMRSLSRTLAFNENVIRHTVIKIGDKLSDITAYKAPETLV
ncbi:hypothetical protein HDU85_002711 [Gaertneriomyces sp. JEL0708]|nr:hypothetical protein HDU85_002711 [Gaertneriomyces sp. JEL0708]